MNANRPADDEVVPPSSRNGPRNELLQAADYAALFRRRRLLLLVVPIIAVLAAAVLFHDRPPTYMSTAEILVRPLTSDPLDAGSATGSVNARTEAEVATSTAVLTRTLPEMGGLTLTELDERLEVTADEEAQILRFGLSANDPEVARTRLVAVTNAYLDVRSETAVDLVSQAVTRLENRATTIEQELAETSEQLAELNEADDPNQGEIATLQSRESVLSTQLAALINQLASRSLLEINPGELLSQPTFPIAPSGLSTERLLLLAFVAGVIGGATAAVLWDRLDPRVASLSELEGMLGRAPDEHVQVESGGTLRSLSHDAVGRRLALAIASSPVTDRTHVAVVTESGPSEHVPALAFALARALTAIERRVLVAGPDGLLRGATGRDDLRDHSVGVQTWQGDASAGRTRASNLFSVLERSSQALSDPTIRAAWLRGDLVTRQDPRKPLERYDDLIVVAPGIGTSVDAFEYASFADATVVGVTLHVTRRDEVMDALRQLHARGQDCLVASISPSRHLGDRVQRSLRSFRRLARVRRRNRAREPQVDLRTGSSAGSPELTPIGREHR